MKKSKILAAVLALVLVVTGCGSKTVSPEEALKKASEKMEALDNYHVAMTMDMSFTEGGVSATMSVNIDGDYDDKNDTSYMIATASMFGMDMETETYEQTKGGKTTTYTSDDGEKWTKEVTEEDQTSTSDTTTESLDVVSKSSEIKVVKEENGATTYEATLSEEETKELLESMDMGEQEAKIGKTTVTYTINKDGYISHLAITIPVTVEDQTSTVKLSADFSKFNAVGDIVIPQEIIDNAVVEAELEAE